MPYTLAEKILLTHSDADEVAPGDIVMVRCDVVMTNDISGPTAFRAMEKMGAKRVFELGSGYGYSAFTNALSVGISKLRRALYSRINASSTTPTEWSPDQICAPSGGMPSLSVAKHALGVSPTFTTL